MIAVCLLHCLLLLLLLLLFLPPLVHNPANCSSPLPGNSASLSLSLSLSLSVCLFVLVLRRNLPHIRPCPVCLVVLILTRLPSPFPPSPPLPPFFCRRDSPQEFYKLPHTHTHTHTHHHHHPKKKTPQTHMGISPPNTHPVLLILSFLSRFFLRSFRFNSCIVAIDSTFFFGHLARNPGCPSPPSVSCSQFLLLLFSPLQVSPRHLLLRRPIDGLDHKLVTWPPHPPTPTSFHPPTHTPHHTTPSPLHPPPLSDKRVDSSHLLHKAT